MTKKVAIVEDTLAEAALLKEYFDKFSKERNIGFDITHFDSGETFIDQYRPIYDIIILDIGLPNLNGMEVATALRQVDSFTTIVFVTNMAQFAVKGYEVNAFDFVVKPVSYANFALKMQRVLTNLRNRQDTDLLISTGDTVQRISSAQVKYIEVSGHNIIIHTTSGNIASYGTLKKLEESLNGKVFVRCNNCYLINLNYVTAIKGQVVLVDKEELQISRPKKKAFVQALNDYIGGVI